MLTKIVVQVIVHQGCRFGVGLHWFWPSPIAFRAEASERQGRKFSVHIWEPSWRDKRFKWFHRRNHMWWLCRLPKIAVDSQAILWTWLILSLSDFWSFPYEYSSSSTNRHWAMPSQHLIKLGLLKTHSEKREEPKWLLGGTIFFSAEQTPLGVYFWKTAPQGVHF